MAAINDLTGCLGYKQLSPYVGGIIEALLRLVPGQIWDGQGQGLEMLSAIISKCFISNVDLNGLDNNLMAARIISREVRDQVDQNDEKDEIIFTLEDALIKKKTIPPTASHSKDVRSDPKPDANL